MGQLIQFPKKKTVRARLELLRHSREQSQKLALFFILLVTFFIGQTWILNEQVKLQELAGESYGVAQGRSIASTSTDYFRDFEFEKRMAEKIRQLKRSPTSVLKNEITAVDRLRFESALAGKYQFRFDQTQENSRITAINFIGSDLTMDRPVLIKDLPQFLLQHRAAFAKAYDSVEALPLEGTRQEFRLWLGEQQTGKMVVQLDSAQRLKQLVVLDTDTQRDVSSEQ